MKKNPRFTGILCTLILSLGLTACGSPATPSASTNPSTDPASTAGANAAATAAPAGSWLEQAKLDVTTETTEELYEQAKQEGKVTVYSQSSRIKEM